MSATEKQPENEERNAGLTLVVLAAGIGSRYGGLKQLEPVGPGGETFLEYSIFDALRAGFERVVLIVRPETEAVFEEHLGPRLAGRTKPAYAHQVLSDLPAGVRAPEGRTRPWGTGHAVLAARNLVDGPFVVINADDFYGSDSFFQVGRYLEFARDQTPTTFGLAGFEVGPTLSEAGPVSRGLCRADEKGWLETIEEVLKLTKRGDGGIYTDSSGAERTVAHDDLVSMNMWGFTPAIFESLERGFSDFLASPEATENPKAEFILPAVVQRMIARGEARVRVLGHGGSWCGITFPEDRDRAREFIAGLVARGEYPERLWRR